jgi:hypothetical protein
MVRRAGQTPTGFPLLFVKKSGTSAADRPVTDGRTGKPRWALDAAARSA